MFNALTYHPALLALASLDPATLIVGVVAGAAAGGVIAYFTFYSRPRRARVSVLQRDEMGQMRRKTVTVDELDGSKKEMRTLMLERDLLSAALTKVYEAENDGQITRDEREMIARRYSSQIRDLEAKLRDKELIVEVGELEKLREELVSLFREKIQNIESRLDQAKERLQPIRPEPRAETPRQRQAAQGEDLEKVVERKVARKEESEGEKRVRILRDEVMDALEKLEQIDNRKETEPVEG